MIAKRISPWLSPYLLVAVVGLVVYVWGFSLQCCKPGLPRDFPISQISFPVRCQDIVVDSPDHLCFVVEGWDVGEAVTITDADGDSHVAVLVPAESPGVLAVTAVSGLFFWSVCFSVFVPRVRDPDVPLFFWILLLYGLAVMIGGVFFQRRLLSPGALFGLLQITSLALLPPLFLSLTLRFPRRQPLLEGRRCLMPTLWVVAVGLILWQALTYGRYFTTPSPARAAAITTPPMVADIFMLVIVAFGFANLARQIRRLDNVRQIRQIRWLLWGFAVGAAPYLVLRTLPQLLGLPAPLPAGADRVLEIAVPLAFVFAVVWDQFLDIDMIIRRSLLYSTLAAVVLGLMLIPSLVLPWSFGGLRPNIYHIVLLCGGLVCGLAFNPLRRWLGQVIDRWVFEMRREDWTLLAELDEKLQETVTASDVTVVVEDALARWFGCRPVSLELSTAAGEQADGILAVTGSTDSPDLESMEFPEEWVERGFVAACPVTASGGRYGCLLIGPRQSRRRYLRQDLELCCQCAQRCATLLDRLRLIGEKAEEARARQQLDELNRLKSEFLAQAAHDLRSPVTSVLWSTRNLLDGLAGDLAPAQREYLTSVSDAAGHLETLVTNLLDLSQLENAVTELPLTSFDPKSCLTRSVSSIRPLAEANQVRLDVNIGDAPTVRAHPEKMFEILVNILDNAIKYSPPGGTVRVEACADSGRWCKVTVTDDGPGLGTLSNPFDRFTQGDPSPHSPLQGFGLGLYIVWQYVHMMNGEVTGENSGEGGARFVLRLPAAGRAE